LRLDAVFLADHAVAAEGKLYVNGGGITRLNVPFLPFALPGLSLVLRYMLEVPADRDAHALELQFESPSGVLLFPETPVELPAVEDDVEHVLAPGEEQYAQAVLSVAGVPIIETGLHKFSVRWDGELVREFALPVVLLGEEMPAAPPAPNRAERRRQERASGRGQ